MDAYDKILSPIDPSTLSFTGDLDILPGHASYVAGSSAERARRSPPAECTTEGWLCRKADAGSLLRCSDAPLRVVVFESPGFDTRHIYEFEGRGDGGSQSFARRRAYSARESSRFTPTPSTICITWYKTSCMPTGQMVPYRGASR